MVAQEQRLLFQEPPLLTLVAAVVQLIKEEPQDWVVLAVVEMLAQPIQTR
jgi:hypothetical protein